MMQTTSDLSRSLRRNLVAGFAGLALLFGGVGGWAATTELSGAVIAPGLLAVDGNAKKVQHISGGIVAELLVREGEIVSAGQVLVRLDATVTRANLAAITQNLNQLYARQARLAAERDGTSSIGTAAELLGRLSPEEVEAVMASERRLFEDRRGSRDGQKARLAEQIIQLKQQIDGLEEQHQAKTEEIGFITQELGAVRSLFEQGIVTLNRLSTLEQSAARSRGERGQIASQIAAAQTRISEAKVQLMQIDQDMRTEVATELRDVEIERVSLQEREIAAQNELNHIEIKAPIAGTVHQLAIHTVGGVVTPAETLMQIVPRNSVLTVEARIAPRDIDQLALGQNAILRLSAFNRNTTPELLGTVTRISADLETDPQTGATFYGAAIEIPEAEILRLPDLALVPGMPVEAFIRIGDRTVLSYFAKPISDHANRVFREE